MHKYSQTYLFQLNSKEEIYKWITHLDYFIFERAFGGHANDSDDLSVTIEFDDFKDLAAISEKLRIDLSDLKTEDKEKIVERNLESSVFLGHQQIVGFRWGVFVSNKAILIYALNSQPYLISDIDYKACKQFEAMIVANQLSDRVPIQPLRDRPRAITLSRYKDYFDELKLENESC
jgi:hypothetical protein